MSNQNWRIAEDYKNRRALNSSSIAWEFLRRNPDYRNDCATLNLQPPRDHDIVARRWGLRFSG
ncbi:transcriptional regulator domain-containing protein [Acidiphilium sp. MT5]